MKIGKVSPIHKSSDRDNLNNYRPIPVLPTIASVFEQKINCSTDNKLHSTALA